MKIFVDRELFKRSLLRNLLDQLVEGERTGRALHHLLHPHELFLDECVYTLLILDCDTMRVLQVLKVEFLLCLGRFLGRLGSFGPFTLTVIDWALLDTGVKLSPLHSLLIGVLRVNKLAKCRDTFLFHLFLVVDTFEQVASEVRL